MADDPASGLYQLVIKFPYIRIETHCLYDDYVLAKESVDAGSGPDALRNVEALSSKIENEKATLARQFDLFDHSVPKKNFLNIGDLKAMFKYLGFPSDDAAVTKAMTQISRDGNKEIDVGEFQTWVGELGGSEKLFEKRYQRIEQRFGSLDKSELDRNSVQKLANAGFDEAACSYWRMVVPKSEFVEAAKLVTPQQKALKHIRQLAKQNHEKKIKDLQARCQSLRIKEDELWVTLSYIRELAPVIVHINLDKMLQYLENDTNYRNQFETNTSGGLLKPKVREKWESDLFGKHYDQAKGPERPKYGVQNVMNDPRGVRKCKQYGDSYVTLKNARLRCTFAPEDSANLKSEKLAVLDFYAHVLFEYSDQELQETIKVANSADAAVLGDSDKVGNMKYKEAQIHGDIAFASHVERLVAADRHRGKAEEKRIKDVCAKHGWKFSWMDQEADRMRKEDMGKYGKAAWEEKMQEMMAEASKYSEIEVPEGFCRMGCGKRVHPGLTRSRQPYTTCCRGCVLGFGHDWTCQKIDASKVGEGLCKNGCGRKVASGTDKEGRPLTTCCRGCAMGRDHDPTCGKVVEEGFCKVACGRTVAPGLWNGKPFSTCCQHCVKSNGTRHSQECEEAFEASWVGNL